MSNPWESESCEHVQSYFTVYPVPMAAALWCGIPISEVDEHLSQSKEVHYAIFRHPYIPCLEPRCRAIHAAIESGVLPVSRENGKVVGSDDRVAASRRHVSRQHLKEWIAKEFPGDKPAFLFDEVERLTHPAISEDAYRALQADRDALRTRISNAETWAKETAGKIKTLTAERDALRDQVNAQAAVDNRSATTYLNIIGGLLGLMLGKSPAGKSHSVFNSQASVIEAIVAAYGTKDGVSKRNLEAKFAEAKRSIEQ